ERDRRDEAEHDRGDEMDSRDAARTQQPPIERPHRYGRGRDGTRAGSRPPGPASRSRASRSIGVFTSPKSSRPTRRRKTQYVHACERRTTGRKIAATTVMTVSVYEPEAAFPSVRLKAGLVLDTSTLG